MDKLKQAEEFLRAKGLTGDFKTKRILTPEQGTLVEWFVEFANQQNKQTVYAAQWVVNLYQAAGEHKSTDKAVEELERVLNQNK